MSKNPEDVTPGKAVTERVLAVLSTFDFEHRRLTLSEIARRSGLPVATVYRLAGHLVAAAALERDEDGKYRIGRKIWELGTLTETQEIRKRGPLMALDHVVARIGLPVRLIVPHGNVVMCLMEATPASAPGLTSQLGRTESFAETAAGIVLAAGMPPEDWAALPLTPSQLESLEVGIEHFRKFAYARRDSPDRSSELAVGMSGVMGGGMALLAEFIPAGSPGGSPAGPRLSAERVVQELWAAARALSG